MEGALAIATSVTCSIVSGCQNYENHDVEEEASDGEAHEEDVIYMTAMSDCCEKVLRSSGALQPLLIIYDRNFMCYLYECKFQAGFITAFVKDWKNPTWCVVPVPNSRHHVNK